MTMITSADELCAAAEALLREKIEAVATGLGYDLGEVATWQQLPVADAIAAADLPAIAISTPGLVENPSVSYADGVMTATWGLAIGIYARGEGHEETQARVRNWCAVVRTTLLTNKSIGGIATDLEWTGERFDLYPDRENARTFGGGTVSFDVTVEMPLNALTATLPSVATTGTALTVQ